MIIFLQQVGLKKVSQTQIFSIVNKETLHIAFYLPRTFFFSFPLSCNVENVQCCFN